MSLTFDERAHEYRWNGVVVPSVSALLRPLTEAGLAAIPPHVLQLARDRGIAVHKACELDDLGTLGSLGPDGATLAPYLEAWRKFSREHDVLWDAIEEPLYHPLLRYAGTPDRRGFVLGKRAIVDIKATARLMPTVALQLTAYAMALHHDDREGLDNCQLWGVKLSKDGSFEAHQYDLDIATVAGLVSVYRWKERHGTTG